MNFYEYLAQLEAKGAPFAIATIVHASDNSPGRTSFKMCVTEDGTVMGSIGGGALEYEARNTALEMRKSGERTRIVKYQLKDKAAGGIGMACGGDAEVFIETITPRRQLVIFGGGHIGDNACTKALLKRTHLAPIYIGLIGSAKKLARVFNNMIEEGYSRESLAQIHAPIGIDTGGQSATEIAIGITAQIIAARYGKTLADAMDQKKHPLSIDLSKPEPASTTRTLFDHAQI